MPHPSALPAPRRSAQLTASEVPNFVSILDKATIHKKQKLEDLGRQPSIAVGELPGDKLLALEDEEPAPLTAEDIKRLIDAYDIFGTVFADSSSAAPVAFTA